MSAKQNSYISDILLTFKPILDDKSKEVFSSSVSIDEKDLNVFVKKLKQKLKKKLKDIHTESSSIYKIVYHPNGVYSEQIFGPVNDYICQCGYLEGIENQNKVCPYCNVKCAPSIERYKNFGYISLRLPIVNPELKHLFLMKLFKNKLEFEKIYNDIVYEDGFYLFNRKKGIFEVPEFLEKYEHLYIPTEEEKYNKFVEKVLEFFYKNNILTQDEINEIKETYVIEAPVFGLYSLYKALKHSEIKEYLDLKYKDNKKYQKFKDILFLDFLPVLPPEVRPFIVLETGEVLEHKISKKYRSIIRLNYENPFLFDLLKLQFQKYLPKYKDKEIVNEKVNDLYSDKNTISIFDIPKEDYYKIYDNPEEQVCDVFQKDFWTFRLQKQITELFDLLFDSISGKEGKIRQFMLGNIIDFSGRAVITPSLKIKPYEVAIPYKMAYEVLFPYFVNFLIENYGEKLLAIKYMLNLSKQLPNRALSKEEKQKLEKYFKEFINKVNNKEIKIYTFFNRQPTIWIYSIFAFDVVVKEDKNDYTISLHPLINEVFNADFDGDSIYGKIKLYIKDENKEKEIKIDISELKDFEI